MEIKNSCFVITGGGSGLGLATAQKLVELGGNVHLIDINEEQLKTAASQLGDKADYSVADVTNEQQVSDVFAGLSDKRIGGVVNCAGICPAHKILGKDGIHPLDVFSRTLQVNVVGSFNVMRHGVAAMAAQEPAADGDRGVVINVASVAAYEGQIGQAAYSASKGAIVSMTLPLARELSREHIRVMAIAPGIMGTPMLRGLPDNVQESLAMSVTYPKRLGEPEEFARLAVHIIENGYLNGEVIRLDGAIRMAAK